MDAQYIKGVGPKRAETLGRLGIDTVMDLLYYLPRRYEDRRDIVNVAKVRLGAPNTVRGVIRSHSV